MQFQKIHIIINPAAGQDDPILNKLNTVLDEYGIEWDVSITHKSGDARRQAADAARADVDLIAVYGGDGTIMEVVNALIEYPKTMAILPGGTGNALAAALGIPRELTAAIRLIGEAGVLARIDAGKIGRDYFVVNAGCGFVATLTQQASRELKDRFGIFAYVFAGLRELSRARPTQYQLTIDGKTIQSEGIACLILNTHSVGSVKLNYAITPQDGLLDVMILNKDFPSITSIAASIAQIQPLARFLQHWQASEVTVLADETQELQADGEVIGTTPFSAQAAPAALQILTPRSNS